MAEKSSQALRPPSDVGLLDRNALHAGCESALPRHRAQRTTQETHMNAHWMRCFAAAGSLFVVTLSYAGKKDVKGVDIIVVKKPQNTVHVAKVTADASSLWVSFPPALMPCR
jgi:hypothetical protein